MSPLEILQVSRNLMKGDENLKAAHALALACRDNKTPLAPNGYGRAYLALKRAMWPGDRYPVESVDTYQKQNGRDATMLRLDEAIEIMEKTT